MKGRVGNSRNDDRSPRLPKDPKKREREIAIREYAKNNGFSIATARIMWEESEAESEETEMDNKTNGASLQTVIARLENLFEKFNEHFFNGTYASGKVF